MRGRVPWLSGPGAFTEAALGAAGDDTDRLARLEAALGKHLAVLQALTAKVPEQARDAIEHAIDSSSKAVERIGDTGGAGPSNEPGGPGKPGHTPGDPPSDRPSGSPEDEQ